MQSNFFIFLEYEPSDFFREKRKKLMFTERSSEGNNMFFSEANFEWIEQFFRTAIFGFDIMPQ
jgi:hypothetical protein